MRRLPVLAFTALVLVVPAPPATAATETVATLDRPAPVSAYAGRVLWSRYDATADRYRLVTRFAGQVSEVPVAPRAVPFDADLGPDARGATVAVYSRCRTDPPDYDGPATALYGKGKGCDLYRFDFATGRESAITSANARDASEFWPTIWKGTLAFARTYDAKPDYPYIYTRPVSGRANSTRMPGGPRRVCTRDRRTGATSCSDDRLSRPTALELYGRRLGFGWTYAGRSEGLANEIRLDTIGGGHARLAIAGSGGLTQTDVDWPAFSGGAMFWSLQCFGDPGGCPGRYGLFRHRIATGATERAPGPKSVLAHERDGATTYVLSDATSAGFCAGDPPVPGGTCDLTASQPAFG